MDKFKHRISFFWEDDESIQSFSIVFNSPATSDSLYKTFHIEFKVYKRSALRISWIQLYTLVAYHLWGNILLQKSWLYEKKLLSKNRIANYFFTIY